MPIFNSGAPVRPRHQLPASAAAAAAAARRQPSHSDSAVYVNDVVERYRRAALWLAIPPINGVPDAFGFGGILSQIGARRIVLRRCRGRAPAEIDRQIALQ